ncbi:MAG: hypothetical protein ABJA85_01205 [Bacteroidota bacterium]
MKRVMFILSAAIFIMTVWGCSSTHSRYIDLSTGKALQLDKDVKTGYMVDKETREPVYIYVDTRKKDTIYGKTGQVINGHVVMDKDKKYVFDGDEKLKINDNGAVKYKDGDYKVIVEKDGDMKIKNGDKKVKIDGETGEKKTKKD